LDFIKMRIFYLSLQIVITPPFFSDSHLIFLHRWLSID